MGPRVQTTTWLHELALGHHQGSWVFLKYEHGLGARCVGTASGIREVLNDTLENVDQLLGLAGTEQKKKKNP